jgi:UDP-N-acetylmuramate--alanine ligase
MDDFGRALEGADVVVLTDIYPAGEDPISGVTLQALASRVARDFSGELYTTPSLSDVPQELSRLAKPGDLIVLLGAGSIGSVTGAVLAALKLVEDAGRSS